jgi:hypothetical protein
MTRKVGFELRLDVEVAVAAPSGSVGSPSAVREIGLVYSEGRGRIEMFVRSMIVIAIAMLGGMANV